MDALVIAMVFAGGMTVGFVGGMMLMAMLVISGAADEEAGDK